MDNSGEKLLRVTDTLEKQIESLLLLDQEHLEEVLEISRESPAIFNRKFFHFNLRFTLASYQKRLKVQEYYTLKKKLMNRLAKEMPKEQLDAFKVFWEEMESLNFAFIVDVLHHLIHE